MSTKDFFQDGIHKNHLCTIAENSLSLTNHQKISMQRGIHDSGRPIIHLSMTAPLLESFEVGCPKSGHHIIINYDLFLSYMR